MPYFLDSSPPGVCVFCRLVAAEIPNAQVYEDGETLAFMDLGQVNPGHVLVTLKRHAATLLDCSADEAAALMRTVHRVGHAVERAFRPAGLTVLQANGRAAEQTVFHVHFHVVPRHVSDGVALSWPRQEPPLEKLMQHASQIKKML